jgi:hypothetical protein
MRNRPLRSRSLPSPTSSTFANQASVSQALSNSQTQTKTFERIASQTQATGWQQTTDYTNAMVNELRRKLSDPSRPLVDANHKH